MSNSNKVWFITGTSTGFGRHLAEEVIARGERVVATARDPRTLDALVARAPDRVLSLRLDVTNGDEIRSAVEASLARFGVLDVVVNNAGYTLAGAVEETSDAELRQAFEPMFFGALAVTRAVLPHLRARGAGTIVQITSSAGLITGPGFGAYSAVKHALEAMSEALASEVAPLGIRVLIVEPGMFRTNLLGASYRAMPPMVAYEKTLGSLYAYIESQKGAQAGDPAKAAKAIADAVDTEAPTLRLPLGADAIQSIRGKLAQVGADVDRNEPVALTTAFDDVPPALPPQ